MYDNDYYIGGNRWTEIVIVGMVLYGMLAVLMLAMGLVAWGVHYGC